MQSEANLAFPEQPGFLQVNNSDSPTAPVTVLLLQHSSEALLAYSVGEVVGCDSRQAGFPAGRAHRLCEGRCGQPQQPGHMGDSWL